MSKLSILFQEVGIRKLFRLRKWHKTVVPYVRGFYVSRCVQALDMCGVLDEMRKEGSFSMEAFCREKDSGPINKPLLEKVCEYLFEVGIFNKKGNTYSLTKQGQVLILNKHGYFDFVQAYSPYFFYLPEILMGSLDGTTVRRQDFFVSKATADVSEWLPLPVIHSLIRKYSFQGVIDLGCGYGELLIGLASDKNMRNLHGVDIATDSINRGRELVKQKKLEEVVFLHEGDILNPQSWQKIGQSANLVTIMFVMHEFLGKGEDFLSAWLRKIKEKIGENGFIFLAETPRRSPEVIRGNPTSIAEHHLFHYLSGQHILERDQLRRIIKMAGLNIVEDLFFDSFSQYYLLIR